MDKFEVPLPQARLGPASWVRLHLYPRVVRLLQAARITVSRGDIVWCYRHLLGREPESEAAIDSNGRHFGFRSLARAIAASAEYRGRRSEQIVAGDDTIPTAIGREAFERAITSHRTTNVLPAGQEAYVEMHFERLLDTLNLMQPLLPQAGSIVDFSATGFFRDAITQLLEPGRHVDVTGVNFELDDYAERFGLGSYDLCLNTEVIEHLLFDPSQMLHSINRMLKPGGHLILSTPNAVALGNVLRVLTGNPPTLWNQLNAASRRYYDRHNRDWTPFETTRLLREHGFEVTRVLTRDYYEDTRRLLARHAELALWARTHSTHSHHGDTQFVIGRKIRESEGPVRLSWLYYDAGGPVAEPARHSG